MYPSTNQMPDFGINHEMRMRGMNALEYLEMEPIRETPQEGLDRFDQDAADAKWTARMGDIRFFVCAMAVAAWLVGLGV